MNTNIRYGKEDRKMLNGIHKGAARKHFKKIICIILLLIAITVFILVGSQRFYIAYEESGITLDNENLMIPDGYCNIAGFSCGMNENEQIEFIYLYDNMFLRFVKLISPAAEDDSIIKMELNYEFEESDQQSVNIAHNGENEQLAEQRGGLKKEPVRELYYLSKEQAENNRLTKILNFGSESEKTKILAELKSTSVLIWSNR